MIIQLIITIVIIVGIAAGVIWLLIGKWFTSRWKAETYLEQEAMRRAEIEEASRKSAEGELAELFHDDSKIVEDAPKVQENTNQ